MAIVTHPANDAYRSGWDLAFGKKEEPAPVTSSRAWVCVLCTSGQNAPGLRLEGEHTKAGDAAVEDGLADFAGQLCFNDPKR